MRKLVLSALLLIPTVASADTVILRDGRTFDGTFLTGNSRQITIVDSAGSRRRIAISDIQELRFGSSTTYGSRNRTVDNGSVFGSNRNTSNVDEAGVLARIREDIRTMMYSGTFSSDERRTLDSARSVLDRAATDFRNGSIVNYGDVRSALRDVQDIANTNNIRSQDRDALMSDINQLSTMRSDYGRYRWNR